MKISSAEQLAEAIEGGEQLLEIDGTVSAPSSITLPEGATLTGGTLVFKGKGVRLTKDNTVRDITIRTTDYEVSIYNRYHDRKRRHLYA